MFLTFEGVDGAGKSTQMRMLAERLRAEGHTVVETVEPGGTRIGKQGRAILLEAANSERSPTARQHLFFASAAQPVHELIHPALARLHIVLSDRFTDSSLVYQGVVRGLGAETVLAIDRVACRGLKPELTLCLDMDIRAGLDRARSRNRESG